MPTDQPGDRRRTGRGQEIVIVAPKQCRNGHPLGPYQVIVSAARCDCPGGPWHYRWSCRTCDDVIYSAEHTDDTKILGR